MSLAMKSAISSRVNSCAEEPNRRRKKSSPNASTAIVFLASVIMSSCSTTSAFSTTAIPSQTKPCRDNISPTRRKSRRTASPSVHITTSLQYRNGDDDNVLVRPATSSRIAATNGSSANDESQPARQNTFFPRRVARKTHNNDSGELGLDEYLAFLDRRYNRLYGDDREESGGINDTINWLMERPTSSTKDLARQQEDAQHILGIAAQASRDLLNQHQSPAKTSKPTKMRTESGVVDTMASMVPSPVLEPVKPDATVLQSAGAVATASPSIAGSLSAMVKTRLMAGAAILRKIRDQRDALRMPKVFFELIRQSAMTAPIVAKNAVLTAIAIAGGRANIRLAVTVAASLLIFLKPFGSATLRG